MRECSVCSGANKQCSGGDQASKWVLGVVASGGGARPSAGRRHQHRLRGHGQHPGEHHAQLALTKQYLGAVCMGQERWLANLIQPGPCDRVQDGRCIDGPFVVARCWQVAKQHLLCAENNVARLLRLGSDHRAGAADQRRGGEQPGHAGGGRRGVQGEVHQSGAGLQPGKLPVPSLSYLNKPHPPWCPSLRLRVFSMQSRPHGRRILAVQHAIECRIRLEC